MIFRQIPGMTKEIGQKVIELNNWQGSTPDSLFEEYDDQLCEMIMDVRQKLVDSVTTSESCMVLTSDVYEGKDYLLWADENEEELWHLVDF